MSAMTLIDGKVKQVSVIKKSLIKPLYYYFY